MGDEGLGASAGGCQPGCVLHGHVTGAQVAGAGAAHQDQIGVGPRRGVAATAANALHQQGRGVDAQGGDARAVGHRHRATAAVGSPEAAQESK